MVVGPIVQQLPLAISLNTESTFENFFLNQHNRAVVAGIYAFLQDASETLLYLWGAQGSGVTHLLEAVQHHSAKKCAIQYLPLQALQHSVAAEVVAGLDTLELVCIDNIETIAGDSAWEEALFHLFNRLWAANKKIIIGSHSAPRYLPLALADLQSRLQWGSVYCLHELASDEKIAALQMRAQTVGLHLSTEVAHYLMQRLERSSAQLFAVIKQLDRASLMAQRKLTIPFVKKVLQL
ncbi:MAG: DnaA regulatory inactivator Hda [Cellvibrionaceae bacterium]|nr:DnaA regulatory inactivator Hda [Cellvibrionaceae bacterium]